MKARLAELSTVEQQLEHLQKQHQAAEAKVEQLEQDNMVSQGEGGAGQQLVCLVLNPVMLGAAVTIRKAGCNASQHSDLAHLPGPSLLQPWL